MAKQAARKAEDERYRAEHERHVAEHERHVAEHEHQMKEIRELFMASRRNLDALIKSKEGNSLNDDNS